VCFAEYELCEAITVDLKLAKHSRGSQQQLKFLCQPSRKLFEIHETFMNLHRSSFFDSIKRINLPCEMILISPSRASPYPQNSEVANSSSSHFTYLYLRFFCVRIPSSFFIQTTEVLREAEKYLRWLKAPRAWLPLLHNETQIQKLHPADCVFPYHALLRFTFSWAPKWLAVYFSAQHDVYRSQWTGSVINSGVLERLLPAMIVKRSFSD
jgi:hypothetical protein